MLRLCACMPCFSNGLQVMLISKYQFSKVLSLFEKGLFVLALRGINLQKQQT